MTGNSSRYEGKGKAPAQSPYQVERGSPGGHSLQQSENRRVLPLQPPQGSHQVEGSSAGGHSLQQPDNSRVLPPQQPQGRRQHGGIPQRLQRFPQQRNGSRQPPRPQQGSPPKEPAEAWKCFHQRRMGGPSQGTWRGIGDARSWQVGNQHQQQPRGSHQSGRPSSQYPSARLIPKEELLRKSGLQEEHEQYLLQGHANLVQFYIEQVDRGQHDYGKRRYNGYLRLPGHHQWLVEKGTAQVDGDPEVTAWKQFFHDWQDPEILGPGSLTQEERQGLENVQKYFSEQQQIRKRWIDIRAEIVKANPQSQTYLERLQFPTLYQCADEDILYRDCLEQVALVIEGEARYPPQEPPTRQDVPQDPLPRVSTQAGKPYAYDDESCYCYSQFYCREHDPIEVHSSDIDEWNDSVEHQPDTDHTRE